MSCAWSFFLFDSRGCAAIAKNRVIGKMSRLYSPFFFLTAPDPKAAGWLRFGAGGTRQFHAGACWLYRTALVAVVLTELSMLGVLATGSSRCFFTGLELDWSHLFLHLRRPFVWMCL